jgi:hypothetical protein
MNISFRNEEEMYVTMPILSIITYNMKEISSNEY